MNVFSGCAGGVRSAATCLLNVFCLHFDRNSRWPHAHGSAHAVVQAESALLDVATATMRFNGESLEDEVKLLPQKKTHNMKWIQWEKMQCGTTLPSRLQPKSRCACMRMRVNGAARKGEGCAILVMPAIALLLLVRKGQTNKRCAENEGGQQRGKPENFRVPRTRKQSGRGFLFFFPVLGSEEAVCMGMKGQTTAMRMICLWKFPGTCGQGLKLVLSSPFWCVWLQYNE